jgi:hypothetical protein
VGESVPLSFPSLDGRGQGEGGKGIAYRLSATGVSPWVSTRPLFEEVLEEISEQVRQRARA